MKLCALKLSVTLLNFPVALGLSLISGQSNHSPTNSFSLQPQTGTPGSRLVSVDSKPQVSSQVTYVSAPAKPIALPPREGALVSPAVLKSSRATRRPDTVMRAYEFEVGVEIGSRAFLADSAYNGDIKLAQKIAASTVKNLDKRYLHSCGIKFRLGTVLIRQNEQSDPLRNKVTSTGGGANSQTSLSAFREYWNNHPEIVGTTHDLACYHTFFPPSGLAYGNSVGSRNRYATVGGRGPTSWANGTLCHEFGHSFGLKHTSDSGLFYESKPRSEHGAHSPGGKAKRMSVMVGDTGNVAHLASDEAEKVLSVLATKKKFADPFKPAPIKPFGKRDDVTLTDQSITIDVVANDYDINNDILDVVLLDTVSFRGGKIQLSQASGPGKRNEIKYTAPPSGVGGSDFFHYTVFDSTGRKDFGAVYISPNRELLVDLDKSAYNYDFGTDDSPVQQSYTRITPKTHGDIFWKGKIKAADRGTQDGINKFNQDFVFSSSTCTLRHRIANGRWNVVMNVGDSQDVHDRILVRAEGKIVGRNLSVDAGEFAYVGNKSNGKQSNSFDVTVKDGWLDLKFSDRGGENRDWVVNRLSLKKLPDEKARTQQDSGVSEN